MRFEVTEKGILISPQELIAIDALNKLGEILKERGLTLDELIESGRDIRGELIKEEYGLVDQTK